MTNPVGISAAVEGVVDEAVARRLIEYAGGQPGPVYGKKGKPHLREKIKGYNNAARNDPWLVLVDLDSDAECAPPLRSAWLANPSPFLCLRFAVRQVEAWLMADPESLANYLRVSRKAIPMAPETLTNAKLEMINLARRSRRSAVRYDMVPREGSGRTEGPAYTSRMLEYVERHWRPEAAAQRADSLRRAIDCLRRLVSRHDP